MNTSILKLVGATLLGLGLGYLFFNGESTSQTEISTTQSVVAQEMTTKVSTPNTIACTFEWTTAVSYMDGKIEHDSPHKESESIVTIFSDLNTERPKVRGVGAGKTLYESEDYKVISNTPDKIVLIESTVAGDSFVYTIFKKDGVGIWTKQYDLLASPRGLMSMGVCSSN